jgi:hypothetical protein
VHLIYLEYENAGYFFYFVSSKYNFMQKIKWPVISVSGFAIFYQLTPYFGFPDQTIMALFIIAPLPVIWMAFKILKNGIPSQRTFDEYFYDDVDYKRNKISEG